MRARHRLQSGGKGRSECGGSGGAVEGLLGDRENHGQHILDAVIKLGDEGALALFGFGNAGDVDEGRHHAVDVMGSVAIGRETGEVIGRVDIVLAHASLELVARLQHVANIGLQIRIIEFYGEVAERAFPCRWR